MIGLGQGLALGSRKPPRGLPAEVVESWLLDEDSNGSVSVPRLGQRDNASTINPRRIDLNDPNKALGSSDYVEFVANGNDGTYLQTEATNEAGAHRHTNFCVDSVWELSGEVYPTPSIGGTIAYRLNYSFVLSYNSFPTYLKLTVWDNAGNPQTVECPDVVLTTGQWYGFRCGRLANGKIFLEVTESGTPHYAESAALGKLRVHTLWPLNLSTFDQTFRGRMRAVKWKRWPKTAASASPFTLTQTITDFETTANTGTNGIYHYQRIYDAANSRWVYCFSQDHTFTGDRGVWIGYSNSLTTPPASYALAIPYPTGTVSGRTYEDLHAPRLKYDASQPTRKWLCYAHARSTSGAPVTNGQETLVYSATTPSDNPADWQLEGIAVPTFTPDSDPYSNNHAGYCNVIWGLSGMTNYHAHHLSYDAGAIYRRTVSSDALSFNPAGSPELDQTSPFPAGYECVEWWNSVVELGGNIYGIGRGFFPGGRRGVAACKLQVTSGILEPTGQIWELIQDTQAYPNLGYTQQAMAAVNGSSLYVYRQRGYYPSTSDERVDLHVFSHL